MIIQKKEDSNCTRSNVSLSNENNVQNGNLFSFPFSSFLLVFDTSKWLKIKVPKISYDYGESYGSDYGNSYGSDYGSSYGEEFNFYFFVD